jgi:hypothetical protein
VYYLIVKIHLIAYEELILTAVFLIFVIFIF